MKRIAALSASIALALGCSPGEEASQASKDATTTHTPRLIEKTVVLPSIHLDGFEEGMHGPTSVAQAVLHEEGTSARIWLTRFAARLVNETTGETNEDYFCHVHLLPDGEEASYRTGRFVGVHAGGSSMDLPDGFALPIESSPDEPIHFLGMSADYGKKGEPAELHYEIDLAYYTDADAQALGIRPLEFKFVKLKVDRSQVDGGAHAGHGMEHGEHAGHGMAQGEHAGHGMEHGTPPVGAGPAEPASATAEDEELKYPGSLMAAMQGEAPIDLSRMHWMVPPGRHEFRSPLAPWKTDGAGRRVHQVHLHVHPWAEYGEIYDKTAGETLWRGNVTTDGEKRIVSGVEQYSSSEGFFMPADHEYELVMAVDNPKDVPVDAMLTARLFYVEE